MGKNNAISNNTNNIDNIKQIQSIKTDTCGSIILNECEGTIWDNAKEYDTDNNGALELGEINEFMKYIKANCPPEEYENIISMFKGYNIYKEYNDNGEVFAKTFVGQNSNMQTKIYYEDNKPVKAVISMDTGMLEFDLKNNTSHQLYHNNDEDFEPLEKGSRLKIERMINTDKIYNILSERSKQDDLFGKLLRKLIK